MRFFRAFLITFLFPSLCFAGAWLQPEGKGLAIVQLTRFGSSEFYDANGELNDQLFFSKWELQPYVEYGLSKKLTVGGTAYLQQVEQGQPNNTGIADPEFFLRTRLWHNEHHTVSIQPTIKLPSVFLDGGTPRGGSRSIDAELNLLYGTNYEVLSKRDYLDVRIGYRTRSRGLSDQLRADAALGMFVSKNWQIIPAVRGIQSTRESDAATFREDGEQDYSLLKAEATVAYHLGKQKWVYLSAFDHIAGLNTGAGRGVSVGYAWGF